MRRVSSRRLRRFLLRLTLTAAAAAWPAPAAAQWFFGGYLGTNYTHPDAVTVHVPAADLIVTFDDVRFAAEPFKSPQYYGWRLGRLFGTSQRLGIELEFIHLKVISDTSREYPAQGRVSTIGPDGRLRMDSIVQRYSMTHGLNFILINGVWRRPLATRVALTTRLGAGGTLPHAESTVLNAPREQYQYSGLGAHLGSGLELRLRSWLSLTGEYKVTYARPEIGIAGGTGRTTTLTHHGAIGFLLGRAGERDRR